MSSEFDEFIATFHQRAQARLEEQRRQAAQQEQKVMEALKKVEEHNQRNAAQTPARAAEQQSQPAHAVGRRRKVSRRPLSSVMRRGW